ERARLRGADGAAHVRRNFAALAARVRTLGYERTARERAGDALLARYVMLHPAGFAVLDPGFVRATSREMASRMLAAVVAAIRRRRSLARRRSTERLRDALAEATFRGHTLGGCRFVAWRERILVLRELAGAAEPVQIAMPGASVSWDRRFRIDR